MAYIVSWRAIPFGVLAVLFWMAGCAAKPSDLSIAGVLQNTLEAFREAHGIPGVTAAIVLDDGRSVSVAVGASDRETRTPMTPETSMLAASIGKTFVAAIIVTLSDQELIDLDAPLSTYLSDETWFERLPNGERITIRHLLTHTSGLPDHVKDADFAAAFTRQHGSETPPFSPAELIGFVLDDPALFEPGEGWSYTDTGFVLLGLVIEKVTGNAWSSEVERRFLKPLGLERTRASNRKDLTGLAAGYLADDNPYGLPNKTIGADARMVWNPAIEDAGGGFASTSLDLARWGDALYRGRAISRAALEEMLDGVLISPDDPDRLYGAGVSIETRGELGPVYGHAGWIPGYVSSLRHYPELGATIALQINTDVGLADGHGNPLPALERQLSQIAKDWRGYDALSSRFPLPR